MNITTIKRAGCAAVGAVAMVALAAPNDCYFLVSSGCGSGESFCTENSIVCDVGYSKFVDTGCGRMGPFTYGQLWLCYLLTNTTTHPCNEPPPPENLDGTGCASDGICCYATRTEVGEVQGTMSVPGGFLCCEQSGSQ